MAYKFIEPCIFYDGINRMLTCKILDYLPKISDQDFASWLGDEVVGINELQLAKDCEQPNNEVYDYNYYEVATKISFGQVTPYYEGYFIAIKRGDKQ